MSSPDLRPDLRHVNTWLFDLDNTLYPAGSGFMGEIEGRMTDYVMRVTGLERQAAYDLQKRYLREHGLTLRGLMLNHGVEPAEFCALFHDLSLDALSHDPAMLAALQRLPGRRVIFTNADDVHAERVLRRLGLDGLFDETFHIGSFDFLPKPAPEPFARLVAEHGVDARATAFFEDSARNLKPAAEIGMTTVLVGDHAEACAEPFVHHRTADLATFLSQAQLRDTP
jgi:putative hydrolase of the HAD superfamily